MNDKKMCDCNPGRLPCNCKPVPPAVGEYAVQQLAALKAQQSGVVLPPSPYMPGVEPDSLSDYERGEAQGRCDMWAEVVRINRPASVGDERAAFEAWYLGHFYMGDKQCGLEWLSTEPCGGYRHQHPAEQWIVWQARAALPVREAVADPLREAITPHVVDWVRCGLAANNRLVDGDHPALKKIRAAIAAAPSPSREGE